jgi:AcrR family transcriptional regulator
MVKSDGEEGRPYASALRARRRAETRQLILQAVAELIAEGALHTFSVQDVAARAGISYPTVYRHFPTREALLAGTYEWAGELARKQLPAEPGSLAELPGWIAASIPVFEEHRTESRALLILLAVLNIESAGQQRRDGVVERLVRREVPSLPASQARRAAAVIRYLGGSHAWAVLRDRFGLDAADTTAALTWALDVLIRDLRSGTAGGGEAVRGGVRAGGGDT